MAIDLVRSASPIECKTVTDQSRNDLACCETAQPAVVDRHVSDGDGNPRLSGHLDLVADRLGQWFVMLDHTLNYQVHNLFDAFESLCAGVAPRRRPLLMKRGAVCVPAIFVRLHHDSESVGLHCICWG